MTREEAMQAASKIIEDLVRSGDRKVFEAARGLDGEVDRDKLVKAMFAATCKLADEMMQDANSPARKTQSPA